MSAGLPLPLVVVVLSAGVLVLLFVLLESWNRPDESAAVLGVWQAMVAKRRQIKASAVV
jgi:hypothetical protein